MMQQIKFYTGIKHDSQMSEQTRMVTQLHLVVQTQSQDKVQVQAATPNTSNSTTKWCSHLLLVIQHPELAADSGDIIYVEERSPITRASDQTENIKLIIEF